MANVTNKAKQTVGAKDHIVTEYYVEAAQDERNSEVFFTTSAGELIVTSNAEELQRLLDNDSKATFLKLKEEGGYSSTIRAKGEFESDHLVMSLTVAETAALAEDDKVKVIEAVQTALARQTEGQGIRQSAVQLHHDTDNLHLHMQVSRHAVDHVNKSISTAIDMTTSKSLEELSQLINEELTKQDLNFEVRVESQAVASKSLSDTSAKNDEIRRAYSAESLKTLDIDDVGELNSAQKYLDDAVRDKIKELDGLQSFRSQLQKAMAVHVQLGEAQKEITGLKQNLQTVSTAYSELEDVATELKSDVSALSSALEKRDEKLLELSEKLEESAGEVKNWEETYTSLQSDFEHEVAEKQKLEHGFVKLQTEKAGVEDALNKATAEKESAVLQVGTLEKTVEALKTENETLKAGINEIKESSASQILALEQKLQAQAEAQQAQQAQFMQQMREMMNEIKEVKTEKVDVEAVKAEAIKEFLKTEQKEQSRVKEEVQGVVQNQVSTQAQETVKSVFSEKTLELTDENGKKILLDDDKLLQIAENAPGFSYNEATKTLSRNGEVWAKLGEDNKLHLAKSQLENGEAAAEAIGSANLAFDAMGAVGTGLKALMDKIKGLFKDAGYHDITIKNELSESEKAQRAHTQNSSGKGQGE